ncbi:MAG: hypothetical protein ABIR68_02980 [Ilumatobacteraceae bacterium]
MAEQLVVPKHAVGHAVGHAAFGVAPGFAAARDRTIELLPAFAELVPGGVQRGATIGCVGPAAVSLAMAVAAGPVGQGAWVGVAGVPTFGVRAAVELGVAAERLVLVTESPGGFAEGQWADVVAAMIDGFDVVVLGAGVRRVRPAVARRLQARVQQRGSLLVTVGVFDGFGCDLQFAAEQPVWEGLGDGHGMATARRVEVELRGRRMPRSRHSTMWLPDATGHLATASTDVGVSQTPASPLRRTG